MLLSWDLVLNGRDPQELPIDELRSLVQIGMPLKHRLRLWPQWFTVSEVGNLENLEQSVTEDVAAQIRLDVPRTQPRCLTSAGKVTLQRVLCAYASLDPVVGYCQGLNNIAAVFIMLGFDDCAALCGLSTLVQSCCPGYHGPGLWGYLRDVAVLDALARHVLPTGICSRLDSLDIPLDVLASDHLLSLTSHSWPLEATAQLWDLFFLEGQPAVFASFLGLLQAFLPCVDEQEEHAPGSAIPGAVAEPLEPVDIFRQAIRQGVANDLGTVLHHVRALIPLIPQALIDDLRRTQTCAGS